MIPLLLMEIDMPNPRPPRRAMRPNQRPKKLCACVPVPKQSKWDVLNAKVIGKYQGRSHSPYSGRK